MLGELMQKSNETKRIWGASIVIIINPPNPYLRGTTAPIDYYYYYCCYNSCYYNLT